MRVNIECIRDFLICMEYYASPSRPSIFYDFDCFPSEKEKPKLDHGQSELLEKYDNLEIIDHLLYCRDRKFILVTDSNEITYYVEDLTISGYDFLATIKNENNWETIKKIVKTVGCDSIPVISEIASRLISKKINQELEKI